MGEHEYVPRLVEALVGKKVVGVSAGGGLHSSLTEAGELFTFGYGGNGRPRAKQTFRRVMPTLV